MKKDITLRPHHLVCILGFVGESYSSKHAKNVGDIVSKSKTTTTGGPELIKVSTAIDDICSTCPHNQAGICLSQQKILNYDEKFRTFLQIQEGQRLNWSDIIDKVRKYFKSADDLKHLCGDCQWYPYGYCYNSIKKILTK